MKAMRACLVTVLLIGACAPTIKAQAFAAGIGYGAQSGTRHPQIVVAQAAAGVGGDVARAWLIAPAVCMAMLDGRTGWRVHLALEARFRWTLLTPYLGVGPSWTSEIAEADWGGSQFGMVMLAGVRVALKQLTVGGAALAAFVEADSYAHGYAKRQVFAGLRLEYPR